MIKNDNPVKGTETALSNIAQLASSAIKNDNPVKGTETGCFGEAQVPQVSMKIKNDNPVKGTETIKLVHIGFTGKP